MTLNQIFSLPDTNLAKNLVIGMLFGALKELTENTAVLLKRFVPIRNENWLSNLHIKCLQKHTYIHPSIHTYIHTYI